MKKAAKIVKARKVGTCSSSGSAPSAKEGTAEKSDAASAENVGKTTVAYALSHMDVRRVAFASPAESSGEAIPPTASGADRARNITAYRALAHTAGLMSALMMLGLGTATAVKRSTMSDTKARFYARSATSRTARGVKTIMPAGENRPTGCPTRRS